jgi:CDP-glucose 4,6-dehydratase
MVMERKFWRGKRVFITGNTGFKGGWLTLWLVRMGAEVHGYALPAPTNPSFFSVCDLRTKLKGNTLADIRDHRKLAQAVGWAKPQIIFHLAAQPLVRRSYELPVETYDVNVMGTLYLLEAIRKTPGVRAVVNITTDKCYENHKSGRPHKENEPMGGYDPYSNSKGCSELLTAAYRRSFLNASGIFLATARAGNVIGGGDWATDRLVPDFFRALEKAQTMVVRSPNAIRSWQHVLEPLAGYLRLAQKLYTDGQGFAEAWNFGPERSDACSVRWLVEFLCRKMPGSSWKRETASQPHEAHCLKLTSSKAKKKLGWCPRWSLVTALEKTIDWHQAQKHGSDMMAVSLSQIDDYEKASQR